MQGVEYDSELALRKGLAGSVDLLEVDGEADVLVGGAVLEGGTLPPPVTAVQSKMRRVGLVLDRAVTHPAPPALPLLCQGAVHRGLVFSARRIGGYFGVSPEVEHGGIQSSGVAVPKI